MKSTEDQNYYEILDLPNTATWAEIQASYTLAKKTYSENALGGYTLFEDSERSAILEKIETAYQVLSDPQKKMEYDRTLSPSVPSWMGPAPSAAYEEAPPAGEPLPEGMTGARIKWLREKRGMTLEEIAETTRININYLSHIEADRFESLPAEVYVNSYLQQMIKLIQCSDNQIVEQYMQEYRKRRLPSRR